MRASKTAVLLAIALGGMSVRCDPEPGEPIGPETEFQIVLLWGTLCDVYVEELGYSISADTSVQPTDTEVTVYVTKTYPSGESHLYGYDFQVDAFDYDDQGFYLYLSSDEEGIDFEVVADYLPYDPNAPGYVEVLTEGEMTMYYGPFQETYPVGPEWCEDAVWQVFLLY